MKEVYEKPKASVVEFILEESIAVSGNGVALDEWFYEGNSE